jgi:hypothetical protein
MANSRNPLPAIAFILALVAVYSLVSSHKRTASSSESEPADSESTSNLEFDGYTCTVDCSGHEAGYRWAEEHNIDDGDDCDRAGEHSNSPSFAEGCHAYVDGDAAPEDQDEHHESVSDDPDEEN